MKKLFSYITIVLVAAIALTSCDKNLPPIFDDATMAFVAFDETTVYVDEAVVNPDQTISQTANIRIPVTLASVAGLSETVTFTVKDGTAVSGTNYKLVNPSASLSFDKDNRTQYIEFEIFYYDAYTGDLRFTVTLDEQKNINLGYDSECTVVIGDIDHPLVSILGSYTASGEDYWDGPSTWTMTLYKDDTDDHMVWFDNIFNNAGWAGSDTRYYGIVNDDLTQIIIPLGQESEYKYSNGNPILLLGIDQDEEGWDEGSIIVEIIKGDGGVSLDFGDEYGIWAYIDGAGSLSIILPGITADKD